LLVLLFESILKCEIEIFARLLIVCLESEFNLLLLPLRGISDIELFLECAYLFPYVIIDHLAYPLLLGLFAAPQLILPLLYEVHPLSIRGRLLYLQPQLPNKVLDVTYLLPECVLLSDPCRILHLEVHVLPGDVGHHHPLPLDSPGELPLQRNVLVLQVLHLLQLSLGRARSVLLLLLVDRVQLGIQIRILRFLHLLKVNTLPFIT
jgi:hypothetical protein